MDIVLKRYNFYILFLGLIGIITVLSFSKWRELVGFFAGISLSVAGAYLNARYIDFFLKKRVWPLLVSLAFISKLAIACFILYAALKIGASVPFIALGILMGVIASVIATIPTDRESGGS